MLQPEHFEELKAKLNSQLGVMTNMPDKSGKVETRLGGGLTVTSYWCGGNVLRIDIKGFNNVGS